MHHVMWPLWTLLGIWAYCFIGSVIALCLRGEFEGLKDDEAIIIGLIWPIAPILEIISRS